MTHVTMKKPVGFSLAAASEFYRGFTPGSGMAAADAGGTALTLAFRLDKTYDAVAAELRESGTELRIEVGGTDDIGAVIKQVARMLGLDVDGQVWLDVGKRDRVVGGLQRDFAGFFTAAKASPYDAAVWSVIQPRMSMAQAARIKIGMAREHGDVVRVAGAEHAVFPSPSQLLAIESVAGLSEVKMKRLHGVAHAALVGTLDADRLRAMPEDDALADLQRLPGVGPWSAGHIYYRGAAIADALPVSEPRLFHGMAAAYGKSAIDVDEARAIAERWRPLRMWVCVLMARHLGRVGGWHNPTLRDERAAAGKSLLAKSRRVQSKAARA